MAFLSVQPAAEKAANETLLSTARERSGSKSKQAQASAPQIAGRSAEIEAASFSRLEQVAEGEQVRIPLLNGSAVSGVVNFAERDAAGWRRVAGNLLEEGGGTFSFSFKDGKVNGMAQLPRKRLAYEVTNRVTGDTFLTERPLKDLVCLDLPHALAAAAAPAPQQLRRTRAASIATPIFSSRPQAPAVILLDFDGAKVRDPAWNGGSQIDAQPSGYSVAEIRDIWRRVKEDYLPFNIDVTTDPQRYQGVRVGARMRCIITPSNFLPQATGGIGYVDSFSRAGDFFTGDIPCWVFVTGMPAICANAISHEVGHTFGLHHDGCHTPSGFVEYYEGQGSGPTSWGPIMGAPNFVGLSQWSKGSYPGANCFEDDMAIIASATNGIAYAVDKVGDTPATALPLVVESGRFSRGGNIEALRDVDLFSLAIGQRSRLAVDARGVPGGVGNLDLRLDLLDSTKKVIATSAQMRVLGGSFSTYLDPGTYYVRVQGWGEGDIGETGYTRYGSRGHYTLSGQITPAP